ncbi:MAG: hypothetical protein WC847_01415 [Candidatus Paceibacterota bacterium]|jgi:hypothetical protein
MEDKNKTAQIEEQQRIIKEATARMAAAQAAADKLLAKKAASTAQSTPPTPAKPVLPTPVSSADVKSSPTKPKELKTSEILPDGTVEHRTNGELTLRIYKSGLTEIYENGKLVTKIFSDGSEVHYGENGERIPPPLPKMEPTPPPLPSPTEEDTDEPDIVRINEVKDFVKNLGLLVPEEFKNLKDEQQVKVIQDLKRRIVDMVKSDAQTQYSEDLKQKGRVKKLWGLVTKEKDLKNLEKKIFESTSTEEGRNSIIKQDLEILTKKAQNQEIYLYMGEPIVNYLKTEEGVRSVAEKNATDNFNAKADSFTKIPYEWGQEKSGKHRKEYDKAKAEYDKAREEVLKTKSSKEKETDKGQAMLEMLEIDNVVKMEQLLNTHPEFEQALDSFEKGANGKEIIQTGKNLLNQLSGRNWTNRALIAGGALTRWGIKSVGVLAGTTAGTMTAIAAPIVGGVVGGIRGRIRGKETLEERQKEARHGKKDTSKEKVVMADAAHLSSRLEILIREIENASDPKEKNKKLAMLATRVEHTQGKLEKGQINFGDSKTALINQYNLTSSLNNALIIKETLSENTDKEIKKKIDQMLKVVSEEMSGKTTKAQKEFIKKQMLQGAVLGAGLAAAGYGVRALGEHLGWWGGHGAENIMPKTSAPHDEITPVSPHDTPASTQAMHGATATETVSPSAPGASQAINNFTNEGIKFEHGKGGIQGILDLKKQIIAEYNGDYSKAPASVQEFMDTDATKEAIKLGFYDPSNPNESALIKAGSILKFDEHGNLLFGEPDASGNIPVLEKYHGGMFDSDGSGKMDLSGKILVDTKIPQIPNIDDTNIDLNDSINSATLNEPYVLETHAPSPSAASEHLPAHKQTAEELSSTIKEQMKLKPGEHSVGTRVETGTTTARVDAFARTGRLAFTGGVENEPVIYNYGNHNQEFPGLSMRENQILQAHPEFGDNHFHLTDEKLIETYEVGENNKYYIFKKDPSHLWDKFKNMRVGTFLKDTSKENENAASINLKNYLNTLQKTTNLEPKGFFGRRTEKIEHYIARALQKAASIGKLKEIGSAIRE